MTISRVSECMRVEVLIRWSNLFGMLRLVVVHLSAQKVNWGSSLVSRSSSSINGIQFFPAVLPLSSLPGLARFSYWS